MLYFIADFGHYNYDMEALSNLQKYMQSNNPSYILLGGDNFYPSGIIERSKETCEGDFNKIFGEMKSKMYGVLGNHDYYGMVKYQIDNPNLYKMPSNYYKFEYKNYDILMIDTQILASEMDDLTFNVIKNLPIDQCIDKKNVLKEAKYNHLLWLDNELKKINENNRIPIVIGHYPIYSEGIYKRNNNDNKLLECLLPLFIKHDVPVYLSGHDHISQVSNFNINELYEKFKTCTDVDPIVKQLFPEIDNCTELYPDYKLTTIISGACIDLYSFFDNKEKNFNTLYFESSKNILLGINLEKKYFEFVFFDIKNNYEKTFSVKIKQRNI